jgi:hypothetical protein
MSRYAERSLSACERYACGRRQAADESRATPQGSPIPAAASLDPNLLARAGNSLPPPVSSPRPGGLILDAQKIPHVLGTCPICPQQEVKGEDEGEMATLLSRKNGNAGCIYIYIGKRDRKGLFTFTLHSFNARGSAPSLCTSCYARRDRRSGNRTAPSRRSTSASR